MKKCLIIIAAILMLPGCTSFNERFYVATSDGEYTNYFRIDLRGSTVFTGSEFQAGTAPSSTVDRLFGDALGTATGVKAGGNETPETGQSDEAQVDIIDPATGKNLCNQKIVLVLSTKPEQVFSAIKNMISQQIQEDTFALLIGAPDKQDFLEKQDDFKIAMYEVDGIVERIGYFSDNSIGVPTPDGADVAVAKTELKDILAEIESLLEDR